MRMSEASTREAHRFYRYAHCSVTLVPAWPRYLLLLQVVWVYFSGGQNKASHDWDPFGGFTALGNALLDPHNGRLDPSLVYTLYPLTRVATALTIVFELSPERAVTPRLTTSRPSSAAASSSTLVSRASEACWKSVSGTIPSL